MHGGTQDYKRMTQDYHMRAVVFIHVWQMQTGRKYHLYHESRMMHTHTNKQSKQSVHGGRVLRRSLLFPFARKRLTPEETWESNQSLKQRRGRGGLVRWALCLDPFPFGRTWPRRDGRGTTDACHCQHAEHLCGLRPKSTE